MFLVHPKLTHATVCIILQCSRNAEQSICPRPHAPYPIDRNDALKTIQLLHAFYRSDEVGAWADVSATEGSMRLGQEDDELSKLYRTARK